MTYVFVAVADDMCSWRLPIWHVFVAVADDMCLWRLLMTCVRGGC
jgi:hypothetical protein